MQDQVKRFQQHYDHRFLMRTLLLVAASLLMVFGTTGHLKADP